MNKAVAFRWSVRDPRPVFLRRHGRVVNNAVALSAMGVDAGSWSNLPHNAGYEPVSWTPNAETPSCAIMTPTAEPWRLDAKRVHSNPPFRHFSFFFCLFCLFWGVSG